MVTRLRKVIFAATVALALTGAVSALVAGGGIFSADDGRPSPSSGAIALPASSGKARLVPRNGRRLSATATRIAAAPAYAHELEASGFDEVASGTNAPAWDRYHDALATDVVRQRFK